jgi:hypothetical protein
MLCWGSNLEWFTDIFFYNFPLYNKFRAVSMILVIPIFTFPFLAMLALHEVIKGNINKQTFINALKYSLYIAGGLTLLFALLGPALLNMEAPSDQDMIKNGNDWVVDALKGDRARLLRLDAFRSFFFIALAAAALYFYFRQKIKMPVFLGIVGLIVLIDLWAVDKRYFNSEDFVKEKARKAKYFTPNEASQKILTDTDPYYRVLNLATSPFNDALTSYFHKSIGGYSGVKMSRYQDLIDVHLYPEIQVLIRDLQGSGQINPSNIPVMNMLNTRYFIAGELASGVIANPFASGNAWFVKDYVFVKGPNEEIDMLDSLDLRSVAVIDKSFEKNVSGLKIIPDTTATIRLKVYKPNALSFDYKAQTEQLAVFSDIYYYKGWKATIDGKPADIFRVNYILRAVRVPAGQHKIEFEFRPESYYTGEKISFASSLLLYVLLLGGIAYWFYTLNNKAEIPRE